MSRRRSLSEEERALWTGVARSIKPLRARRPSSKIQNRRRPRSFRQNLRAKAKKSIRTPGRASAPHEPQPENKTSPLAPLGRRLKQRVARGREPIEARLDLHGFTQAQAHAELLRFLRRAQNDGVRMALVVTGKGTSQVRRDARTRRAQAASSAVALTRPSFARWSSDTKMRTSVTAVPARFMCACGARSDPATN